MKKIIDFVLKYYFEILITLVCIIVFGVVVLPLTIAAARLFWDMALNAPLPQY